MNKGYQWISSLLIIVEVTINASCVDFKRNWIGIAHRGTFFLRPLPDEEYIPPIPVNLFRPNRGNKRPAYIPVPKFPVTDEEPWKPSLRNSRGFATVTREVYAHPLKSVTYRERVSVSAPTPIVITEGPSTFDIPLKKSIQVSNIAINRPAIQTTGYIKEKLTRKVPVNTTFQIPKHEVIIDHIKETTAHSMITTFDDNWKPKRIPTIKPMIRTTKNDGISPTVSFTRFFNANDDKNKNSVNERQGKSNLPNLMEQQQPTSDIPQKVPVTIQPGSINDEKRNQEFHKERDSGKQSNENLEKHQTFVLQPTTKPNVHENHGKNRKTDIRGSSSSAPMMLPPQNKKNESFTHPNVIKLPPSDYPFYGVEYIEPESNKPNQNETFNPRENQSIHQINNKFIEVLTPISDDVYFKQVHANSTIEESKNKNENHATLDRHHGPSRKNNANPEISVYNNRNKFKVQKSEASFGTSLSNPNNYTNKDKLKHAGNDRSSLSGGSSTSNTQPPILHKQNVSKLVIPRNEIKLAQSKTELDSAFPVEVQFPDVPFNNERPLRPNNKDRLKEIREEIIYFPQHFPKPHPPTNRNNDGNTTSSPTTVQNTGSIHKKPIMDKDRLVEFYPKRPVKNRNDVVMDEASVGVIRGNSFQLPKSVATKDFSSFVHPAPTSPSLITVSSDNFDLGLPFSDSTSKRNKINRTDNYILQRRPALLPETPVSNRPRKPNVRLTTGMLAGILIAALIFLGFLTGTMVYAFHQLKFGKKPKKERHKKRTTYAPEYLDETFAGNTYIHNNIFLPNPQNLEDRLSSEMDTTFSVDSEETAQASDRPSTSGNTRNKQLESEE